MDLYDEAMTRARQILALDIAGKCVYKTLYREKFELEVDERNYCSHLYGTRSGRNPLVGNKPVGPPSTEGCGLNR